MCGIAGVLSLDGSHSPESLASMAKGLCDRMVHRGPDDHGVWADPSGGCALGHRRLSVIDTSSAGHQPMATADGRGILSFNGEIYNFVELRAELEERGVRFSSRSDTEVLAEGLRRFGAAFIERLDGMFAFAYWDETRRRLLLARDRFGEKPLYTWRSGPLFAFASELAAFAALPGFDGAVSRETIAHYLCFQYVPAPLALYRAAAKLAPGTAVEVGAEGDPAEVWRYRFVASDRATSRRPLGDLADELEEILVRTVRSRLVADVPLGAFLSGGVDSSTVVAIATRRLNRSLTTFSIGFEGSQDSEHEEARAMAAHLGTEHVDEMIGPKDLGEMVGLIAGLLDEANGDSSCLPTWLLSGLTRRRVTVAISGDGGDEMFGGYGRYFSTLRDREAGRDGWSPGAAYYSSRMLVFTERELGLLFDPIPAGLRDRLTGLRAAVDHDRRPLMNVLREADARDYMPGAVLPKVDRMSMRHSLEVRSPLLGNEVAAFAATLAESECWDGHGGGKAVLKVVAKRYLPADWIERPKKGFGLPMRSWGDNAAIDLAKTWLAPGANRLSEWLGQAALDRFLAAQEGNPMLYHLWAVLILEGWLRSHPSRPV